MYAKVHDIVRSGNAQEALAKLFPKIPSVRDSKKSALSDTVQQSPVTQLAPLRPAHGDVHTLCAALQQRHLLQNADAVPRCYTCGLSVHMSSECPEKNKNVSHPSLQFHVSFL
jgi:hypothetical protein